MKVHQVCWNRESKHILRFNTLSCFKCLNRDCVHGFFLKRIEYEVADSISKLQSIFQISLNDYNILKYVTFVPQMTENVSSQDEKEEFEVNTSSTPPIEVAPSSAQNYLQSTKTDIELNVGDWVVAQYSLDCNLNGFLKYVAQVIEKRNGEYLLDCLRTKRTKDFKGYIYCYPDVRDNETWVKRENILFRVESPSKWQRALKFTIDVTKL